MGVPRLRHHHHRLRQTIRTTHLREQPPNHNHESENKMNFDQWLQYGYKKGWCGPPVCEIHDGLPTTIFEDEELFEGNDPCIHVVRLYEDNEHKQAVEANHTPSIWRASNLRWKQ